MARMFPDWADAELEEKIPITQDGYDGERKLYKELRKLPKDWQVLYDRTLSDGQGENQIDFLVFVPGMGVVNVDAKGGSARPGEGYHIVDGLIYLGELRKRPFDQARGAINRFSRRVYQLLGLSEWNSRENKPNVWGEYGSLVAFTNKDLDITNEDDKTSYIGATDLYTKGMLEQRIIAQLKRRKGCEEGFSAFRRYMHEILARWTVNDEGRFVTREFAEADADSEKALNYEQAWVLNQIEKEDAGVVHIKGSAGTGKTILACRVARDFIKRGLRALYVCYNETLALSLRGDAHNGGIIITTYHTLGKNVIGNTNLTVWRGDHFDREATFEKTEAAIIQYTGKKFDCIVVDEAQDISASGLHNELLSLRGLMKRSGKMVVFSDKGQSLYSTDWEIDEDNLSPGMPIVSHVLACNFRNKRRVFDHFKKFNLTETEVFCLQNGGVADTSFTCIDDVIKECVEAGHQARDIVILANRWELLPESKSLRVNGCAINLKSGCNNRHIRDDGVMRQWFNAQTVSARFVLMTTIHQFKGLESNIVILLNDGTLTDEECYVGESRAKYKLYVIPSGAKSA